MCFQAWKNFYLHNPPSSENKFSKLSPDHNTQFPGFENDVFNYLFLLYVYGFLNVLGPVCVHVYVGVYVCMDMYMDLSLYMHICLQVYIVYKCAYRCTHLSISL